MKTNNLFPLVAVLCSLFPTITPAFAQGAAFTYQGRLNENGGPANGSYDLQFSLRDAAAGGSPVGGTNTIAPVSVSNGLFTVTLDFGANVFTGGERWLEIGVKSNGVAGAHTPLTPRQPITAAPYAITASNVTGSVAAGQLTGTIAPARIAAGTITSTMLAAGSVTSNQLAAGSVTTSSLADGAVSISKLPMAQASLISTPSITFTNPTPARFDKFGNAVAAAGTDKVFIGAPFDGGSGGFAGPGAAYLFSTNGTLLTTFTNPTPALGDQFGVAVAAISTDRVLIGEAGSFLGQAYIFSIDGTLLKTIANPDSSHLDFGVAVAAVGSDKLLIGAEDTFFGGAAYLFSTNGTLLTTFTNPIPASFDDFGFSLTAVGADKVLIGARGKNLPSVSDAGVAYLFGINGALLITFTNPAPAAGDLFGHAVSALGADKVLIAALRDDTGAPNAGAVYLFSTNGTLLTTFTNPTPVTGDQFGSAVASVGADKVLIAALGDDTGATDGGTAYLFSTNGTLLITFTHPAPAANNQFGFAVTPAGQDRVLIGTPSDNTGAPRAGAAYLFSLSSFYVPGLISEGVVDHSITTADLDFSIGVWSKSGAGLFYNDGNVGIGTNGPQQKLHVLGNILASGTVTATNFSGNGAGLSNVIVAAGSTNYIQNQTATNQTAGFRINGNGIFNGGNVSIGTATSPLRLTVAGSGNFNSGSAAAILLNNTAVNGRDWQWHALDDGRMQLVDFTAGLTRLLIDTNGSVGIGTANPGATLRVQGATTLGDIWVSPTTSGGNADLFLSENVGGSFGIKLRHNGAANVLEFIGVNSSVETSPLVTIGRGNGGSVDIANNLEVGGTVGIGRTSAANALEVEGNASKTAAGNWLANSDARIKTDVRTVTHALEKLAQVRPVEFRYTDEYRAQHPSIEDRPYLNVIAQEFQKVFPGAVKSSGDKLPNGEAILQVDTYPLTIYSAAAIQELNQKLEEKDAELQVLKRTVAELKAAFDQLGRAPLSNPATR
jgi:hypothetical protein